MTGKVRARGGWYYVKPPRKVVPDFLENYQQDAIARGSDGGIILTGLRDVVVHGDLSAEVPADQVEMLVRDLRSITFEIGAAA